MGIPPSTWDAIGGMGLAGPNDIAGGDESDVALLVQSLVSGAGLAASLAVGAVFAQMSTDVALELVALNDRAGAAKPRPLPGAPDAAPSTPIGVEAAAGRRFGKLGSRKLAAVEADVAARLVAARPAQPIGRRAAGRPGYSPGVAGADVAARVRQAISRWPDMTHEQIAAIVGCAPAVAARCDTRSRRPAQPRREPPNQSGAG